LGSFENLDTAMHVLSSRYVVCFCFAHWYLLLRD